MSTELSPKEWAEGMLDSLSTHIPAAFLPLMRLSIKLSSDDDILKMREDILRAKTAFDAGDKETVLEISSRYGIVRAMLESSGIFETAPFSGQV